MEEFGPELRDALRSGATLEQGLARLREAGAHPIAVIKAIREVLDIDLGEAKRIFDLSPAWGHEAEAGRRFHEEIFRSLEEDDDDAV
jgi:ribosomal protein L7/L12